MANAVSLPARLGALHAKRFLFAQTRRIDTVGGYAERDEIGFDGSGSAIAENEVVFRGAAFVAMALDGHFYLGVIAEELRGLAESVAGIGADIGFVEVEVGVLDILQE